MGMPEAGLMCEEFWLGEPEYLNLKNLCLNYGS